MRARVGGAGVPEADEAPVREAVTGGAVEPGDHVPGREADGAGVVVAGGAAADKARVIDPRRVPGKRADRESTRLNSSHSQISYAVLCLQKKNKTMAHASLRSHVT